MKKIVFLAISFAILAACTNEVAETPISITKELTFTATQEGLYPESRTVRMDDGSTWWNAEEEISVFYGSGTGGGSKFTSQNSTLQEIVEFTGSIQMSGSGKDFWAVYPYSQENECDGSSITTIIPAVQTGSEGNFSGDAFPTIAKSKTLDLAFWNICGGIKFFVSRSDIKSVTFKGNGGETLAGKVRVTFNADGKPEVAEVLDGETEVTLNAPDGGTFKPGKSYYITLLPAALDSGFTMTFNTADQKGVVASDKAQTVKRSIFGVLKNIDSKVSEWEIIIVEPEAIDLGLSVNWATFNVGASKPEEYGNYYAWGETEPKEEYTRDNYIRPQVDMDYDRHISTRMVVYSPYPLLPEYDVAHVKLGGDWRMPTGVEIEELIEDCTWIETTVNGVIGQLVTSNINGNSIFLPAAGGISCTDYGNHSHSEAMDLDGMAGFCGYYWSSTQKNDYSVPDALEFWEDYVGGCVGLPKYVGLSVRPVCNNPNPRHVTSVSLDKSDVILYESRNVYLDATVLPKTAANKDIIWSSSAPNVASVMNGRVQAIHDGSTVITATTVDGGYQASCTITVFPKQNIEAVDMGLSVKWASLNLEAFGPDEPGDYYGWGQTPLSEDPRLYKYRDPDNRIMQLEKEDDAAYIVLRGAWRMPTIEEWDELMDNCIWEWTEIHNVYGQQVTSKKTGNSIFLPAVGMYSTPSDLYIHCYVGNGCYWSSSQSPEYDATALPVFFDSSGPRRWYPIRYIGAESLLSIRPVYDDSIPPESVSLSTSELSLYVDYSEQLTATVFPSNASNKDVIWASNDEKVVIVSETGVVTGVSPGTATVTVYSVSGSKTASCVVSVVEPPMINGYVFVDLGLSVKWATCNLGATKPEVYGHYFAWGETEPKSDYSWSTYKFIVSENSINDVTFNKYCTQSSYWESTKPMDNKNILDSEDDAVHINIGGCWRMPTDAEWSELLNNCSWIWTNNYNGTGINGRIVRSNKSGYTDKYIFLPAADRWLNNHYYDAGSYGEYWSSSLNKGYPDNAMTIAFQSSGSINIGSSRRCYGHSVRPVCPND